jgi:hypothetical protein
MKQYLIQSFDIETSGPSICKHNLLAVGIATYKFDKNGCHYIDSLEVHIDEGEINFDASTKEFWLNNKEAFEIIMKDREKPEICADKIINYLSKWQKYSIDNNLHYRIITDNCWFDDSWLSYFLCKNSDNGLPLRYNYHTGYMKIDNVIDISQKINALTSDCCLKIDTKKDNTFTSHDHTPVNDAKGIAERYYKYLIETQSYRKRI